MGNSGESGGELHAFRVDVCLEMRVDGEVGAGWQQDLSIRWGSSDSAGQLIISNWIRFTF